MPVAPRSNKKATKILYKILGKPANLLSKPTEKQKEIDRRLTQQATMRLR